MFAAFGRGGECRENVHSHLEIVQSKDQSPLKAGAYLSLAMLPFATIASSRCLSFTGY
jgi:hypothetical protein